MTYNPNEPNVYEDEEELNAALIFAGCKPMGKFNRSEENHERKRMLVAIMGGACTKCGYSKNIYALEFHHPKEKHFYISECLTRMTNRQFNLMLIAEVKNYTILLCSNCHREEHNQ